MKTCTLNILDQVNVKFDGLDAYTRRLIVDALKFEIPYARHMPAYKLGRWDGKVSFATAGGGTYLNLLERVLPLVIENGYDIDIDDQRPEHDFSFPDVHDAMLADRVWPEGHPMAGLPIMLRDYQVDAIRRFLEHLQSIQSISTGAGKTILTAVLSLLCEPHGRTVVIVPSKSLVEQTEEDYRNLGLDVGVVYGDRKEWGHTHTIATWQSLSVFAKKTRRGEAPGITIDEFLRGVVAVIVDEVHSAKANELKDLLTGPMAGIPIRWGVTGTVPKAEFEFLSLLGSLGPVVGEIRADELQELGVLAKCHIDIMQLVDEVEYRSYDDEYKYLTTDPKRLKWVAEYCAKIAETGNTLILVDRIETGKVLAELLGDAAVFVSGEMKTKDRKKEYKEVQYTDGKIIIATYGVAAVGINIPRLFNLVLFEAGKSFTRIIQSIGRGLRKAHDKEAVHITDIATTAKFCSKHLTQRKKDYKDANYPFLLKKIKYR